jgi:hypothetical protein
MFEHLHLDLSSPLAMLYALAFLKSCEQKKRDRFQDQVMHPLLNQVGSIVQYLDLQDVAHDLRELKVSALKLQI